VAIGALILGPETHALPPSPRATTSKAPPTEATPTGASPTEATPTGMSPTEASTAVPTAYRSDPLATAAREVNLQETGYLHAVGEPGDTIIERGHATGTYDCSISVNLTILANDHVTATFTVRPHGGSVTGRGEARFVQQGADGYFGGTIAITSGAGSYAHASGTNIGISGAVDRETFALTVHVHGTIDV
jgi:hypothetical protein